MTVCTQPSGEPCSCVGSCCVGVMGSCEETKGREGGGDKKEGRGEGTKGREKGRKIRE
jgi:hypothetical protein